MASNVVVKQPSPRATLRALKQPVFDTQEAPAAAGAVPNLQFFLVPQGGALNVTGNLKTVADTNIEQSGQLGVPNQFDLFGFNMSFIYDTTYFDDGVAGSLANFCADIVETYEASVFKFMFGLQKTWLTIPLSRMPHGTFPISGTGDTAVDAEKYMCISNGESRKGEFLKFFSNDSCIPINSAENFSARIEWPLVNYGLTADGDESRLIVSLVGVFYTAL